MEKKRLLELARDPEHIPGIYNYCDRWCESCINQRQCLQFAIEQDLASSDESSLEVVSDCLEKAIELLSDSHGKPAEESVEQADQAGDLEDDDGLLLQRARLDELVQEAQRYASEASSLLNTVQSNIESAIEAVERKIDLDVCPERGWGISDLEKLSEAQEVILRYRHLIRGKLVRAIVGSFQTGGDGGDDSAEDSSRSVGVAWRAIHRSIDSWVTIYRFCPAHSAGILQILLVLDRLRRDVELRFAVPREAEVGQRSSP